jgi:hypothetical protein
MSLGLITVGTIISIVAIIWTLIVANMRAKLILGIIIAVFVILGVVLASTIGVIIFSVGTPVIGIACLIYLLSQGLIFKMR